jgi:hypothetical protein
MQKELPPGSPRDPEYAVLGTPYYKRTAQQPAAEFPAKTTSLQLLLNGDPRQNSSIFIKATFSSYPLIPKN